MDKKWSKEEWDKSIDKVKAILEKQYPNTKCEVWLVGSSLNSTAYVDNLSLNIRVEHEYSMEKYSITLAKGVRELLDSTDDYLLLAAGAALKSAQNLQVD